MIAIVELAGHAEIESKQIRYRVYIVVQEYAEVRNGAYI
jgi:hypothetical protein